VIFERFPVAAESSNRRARLQRTCEDGDQEPEAVLVLDSKVVSRDIRHFYAKRPHQLTVLHFSPVRSCDGVFRILISVMILFLLQVPQAVYAMYCNFAKPQMTDKLRLVATFLNLLVVINCSANFVLYSSLSTRFRRTFRIVFFSSRRRNRANATATAANSMERTYVPHQTNAAAARLANGCGSHQGQLLGAPAAAAAAAAGNGRSPRASPMFVRMTPSISATPKRYESKGRSDPCT
jgi:hypothetical protein